MTRAAITDAVGPIISQLGFKKRAGGVFTIELAPDVVGWLGLNRATQGRPPGEVEIFLVVGVRFQEVERLVAECAGEKFHKYLPPTISCPLGDLMPNKTYRAWVFAPAVTEDVAADMSVAIAAYGIPFLRSVTDLSELRRQLDARCGHEHQLIYRRPVAALLAGDLVRARTLLEEATGALGGRSDLAATDFRDFAESFRSRFLLNERM